MDSAEMSKVNVKQTLMCMKIAEEYLQNHGHMHDRSSANSGKMSFSTDFPPMCYTLPVKIRVLAFVTVDTWVSQMHS